MKVQVLVAGQHLHLTQEDIEALFGRDFVLTPGQFLPHGLDYISQAVVTLVGPKAKLENVPVWGPPRNYSQVELSRTQSQSLGIKAPMRLSGKIEGSGAIKIIGPKGELDLEKGVIVPKRHLHLSIVEARNYELKSGQNISVRVEGERSVIYNKVEVRVSEEAQTVMFIDQDEANCAWIIDRAEGDILVD